MTSTGNIDREQSTYNTDFENFLNLGCVVLQPDRIEEAARNEDNTWSYLVRWKDVWLHENHCVKFISLVEDYWLRNGVVVSQSNVAEDETRDKENVQDMAHTTVNEVQHHSNVQINENEGQSNEVETEIQQQKELPTQEQSNAIMQEERFKHAEGDIRSQSSISVANEERKSSAQLNNKAKDQSNYAFTITENHSYAPINKAVTIPDSRNLPQVTTNESQRGKQNMPANSDESAGSVLSEERLECDSKVKEKEFFNQNNSAVNKKLRNSTVCIEETERISTGALNTTVDSLALENTTKIKNQTLNSEEHPEFYIIESKENQQYTEPFTLLKFKEVDTNKDASQKIENLENDTAVPTAIVIKQQHINVNQTADELTEDGMQEHATNADAIDNVIIALEYVEEASKIHLSNPHAIKDTQNTYNGANLVTNIDPDMDTEDVQNSHIETTTELNSYVESSVQNPHLTNQLKVEGSAKSLENAVDTDSRASYSSEDHTSKVKTEKKNTHVECDICKKVLSSRNSLREHRITVHLKNGRFPCEYCDKRFTNRRALELHTVMHTKERNHVCELCGSSHKRARELKLHMQDMHSEDQSYRCDVCFHTFKQKSLLKVHCFSEHEETVTECIVCKQKLMTPFSIYTHCLKHAGCRDFQCETCKHNFKTKKSLKDHMKIHEQERRPYKDCPKCGKVIYSRSHYYEHVNSHDTESNEIMRFSCTFCESTFQHSSSLKRHILRHRPGGDLEHPKENPYLSMDESLLPSLCCRKCRKNYTSKSGYYDHIKKCRDGVVSKFPCELCNKEYSKRSTLNRHIRTHHPEVFVADFFDEQTTVEIVNSEHIETDENGDVLVTVQVALAPDTHNVIEHVENTEEVAAIENIQMVKTIQ